MQDRITQALKQAMKQRDQPRVDVLRMVLAEIKKGLVAPKPIPAEDSVQAYAKRLRKSVTELRQLNQLETAAEYETELAMLDEFLPKQLPDDQLQALVDRVIAENNITSIRELGRAMGLIMKGHKDVVDGAQAQALFKARLAQSD